MSTELRTVEWNDGAVRLIDQTRLPHEEIYLDIRDTSVLIDAIARLAVRGAPAIGVAGAYGVVLAAEPRPGEEAAAHLARVDSECRALADARPTAVNLAWAVDRTWSFAKNGGSPEERKVRALEEAERIREEDLELSRRMAEHGLSVLPDPARVVTHCNTGGLATAGGGTALGVVLAGARLGRKFLVHVDETRPLLQGARLNSWELQRAGVPYVVQCDGAAAFALSRFPFDAALVGADRIAANGDTANKIGTYALALAAKAHGVPFYVVAPRSSFDLSIGSGEEIPIEERIADEVRMFRGAASTPTDAPVYNPAFDVTPAHLIEGWITERGVERPPFAP
ncbi:MAG: S-methyl-5-thioribose-1-phosphate isomerase [Candidatus Eisenbacteria bacterium]|uniref:Methylthioribose-1-phosphate isomerase n=1 Tax=Eiseniibacteriota bacterium TaxID=2212470 RepID=A0A956N8D0_UNCEI|nr:S-methyl-5-thioribose-1-phosphate isomerase [Candidatus Eisenbacteria bacterium]